MLERIRGKRYRVKKGFFFTNRSAVAGSIKNKEIQTKDLQDELGGKEIMGAYTGKFAVEINVAAVKYNLDPKLIAAVVEVESNFNPKAKSGAGAKGLMQLLDGTFKEFGSGDIWDAQDNVNAGSHYLSKQIKDFGSVELGLAAYNSGPGRVKAAGNKIPAIAETQNYVVKVVGIWGGESSGKGEAVTVPVVPKTGNTSLDKVIKSPFLWVGLLVIFLIK